MKEKHKNFVFSISEREKTITACSYNNHISIAVPSRYYMIANKFLGESTKRFISPSADGMLFSSVSGKTLILGIKR